jgi:hypothetical protein
VKKWAPTRKWWAQFTGGAASIAASWIVTGVFDDVERGMSATLLVACVASYWTKNDTPTRRRRRKPRPAVMESGRRL